MLINFQDIFKLSELYFFLFILRDNVVVKNIFLFILEGFEFKINI